MVSCQRPARPAAWSLTGCDCWTTEFHSNKGRCGKEPRPCREEKASDRREIGMRGCLAKNPPPRTGSSSCDFNRVSGVDARRAWCIAKYVN